MSYGAAVIILAGGEWIQASDPAWQVLHPTNYEKAVRGCRERLPMLIISKTLGSLE